MRGIGGYWGGLEWNWGGAERYWGVSLGDMGELGSYTQEGHWRVGKKAAHSLLSILVCVGELSSEIARAAKEEGFSLECIYQVEDAQAALDLVRALVYPDDALLIKASHSVGLSQVVEGLVN